MSVIVKGMEMPVNCANCFAISDSLGWCKATGNEIFNPAPKDGLPSFCPLRPLPEKHGRLIDAEEFLADYDALYKLNDITTGEWILFRKWLKNQKTVVEAEGDRNDQV